MARLIYACRFETPTTAGLSPILSAYGKWIEGHYRERRGLADFKYDAGLDAPAAALPFGHVIRRDRFVSAKGDVVRLTWAYPADADEGLEWRNDVRAGAFGEVCSVEHLISISSVDYKIVPPRWALGSPSVIRQLCGDTAVQIGDMRVQATPYPLHASNVGDFLELLQSPKRRLPIVFISPHASGAANALDASSMARHLAAVGIVIEVHDPEATWDITDAIGRSLSCFDGGARIYWPGFSPANEPRNHRLYLGARIAMLGPEAIARSIERSIFAVAAFRFAADPRINEVVRDVEEAERLRRVEVQKASTGEDWESYALELDATLSAANLTIADLQAENENLKANQQVYLSARVFGDAEDDAAAEEVAPPELSGTCPG